MARLSNTFNPARARSGSVYCISGSREGQSIQGRQSMNGKRHEYTEMPSISQYPHDNRKDYLLLIAAVAAADSELHPDELELLTRWMDEFELPMESRQEVLAAAYLEPHDLVELEKRLADTDLAYSLILDMMGMAMADGILMDRKRGGNSLRASCT